MATSVIQRRRRSAVTRSDGDLLSDRDLHSLREWRNDGGDKGGDGGAKVRVGSWELNRSYPPPSRYYKGYRNTVQEPRGGVRRRAYGGRHGSDNQPPLSHEYLDKNKVTSATWPDYGGRFSVSRLPAFESSRGPQQRPIGLSNQPLPSQYTGQEVAGGDLVIPVSERAYGPLEQPNPTGLDNQPLSSQASGQAAAGEATCYGLGLYGRQPNLTDGGLDTPLLVDTQPTTPRRVQTAHVDTRTHEELVSFDLAICGFPGFGPDPVDPVDPILSADHSADVTDHSDGGLDTLPLVATQPLTPHRVQPAPVDTHTHEDLVSFDLAISGFPGFGPDPVDPVDPILSADHSADVTDHSDGGLDTPPLIATQPLTPHHVQPAPVDTNTHEDLVSFDLAISGFTGFGQHPVDADHDADITDDSDNIDDDDQTLYGWMKGFTGWFMS